MELTLALIEIGSNGGTASFFSTAGHHYQGADTSSAQYQFSFFMNAAYRMMTLIRTAMVIIMPLAGTALLSCFIAHCLIYPE
jgi:hypothetical protein